MNHIPVIYWIAVILASNLLTAYFAARWQLSFLNQYWRDDELELIDAVKPALRHSRSQDKIEYASDAVRVHEDAIRYTEEDF